MRGAIGSCRAFSLLMLVSPWTNVFAQRVDVRAQLQLVHSTAQKIDTRASTPSVVARLKPIVTDGGVSVPTPPPGHYRMAQKKKSFSPHLLIVPLGSIVEFPNLDPFFHNVFSQFKGKRFDLGLYEAGSTKGVRFDHEGVSYIFCNIHPEMGAVIITLTTPYFITANGNENLIWRQVPAGTYDLHVWAEGADPKDLETLTRRVHVGPTHDDLGRIAVRTSETLSAHKNKFGEDYRPEQPNPY